jgi:putative Holliday junction resolvase
MRVLAVDYGERRTGIAVSDELGITAQGLDTIEVRDESELPERVALVALGKGVTHIVVGLPLNMDGSESAKSRKVRLFGALLAEKTSLPVEFLDERMTSLQAERVMREMNIRRYRNKTAVDRISATLILQDYLKTLS